MQFADNARPDHGLHCPLTMTIYVAVYIDEQRMLKSDCTDAPADLDLHCLQIV